MDHKGNAYREFLTQWDLVDKWCTRIEQLPDYVIDAAIDRVPPDLTSPTTEERAALRTFLLARRSRLREQIIDTPTFFPNLPPPSETS